MAKVLTEEQMNLIEALVKSPVYEALRALLSFQRDYCISQLTTEKSPPKLYELQGQLVGFQIIENLPHVIADQREAKRKKEKAKEEEAQKQAQLRRPR